MANITIVLIVEPTETGEYWGYSPDLSGLHVVAKTAQEVAALAPEIAQSLLQARIDNKLPLPDKFVQFDGSQSISVDVRVPSYEIPRADQKAA